MKKKILIFLFFIITKVCVYAEPDYKIIVDKDFSPYSGGNDIVTLHHYLALLEDRALKRPPTSTAWLNRSGRFVDLIAWGIANIFLVTAQHEIFGHGYRIRDLGSKYAVVDEYKFHWDGAATYFYHSDDLNTNLLTTIDIAGMEATAILANQTRLSWLEQGKIDGRDASLYMNSQHDLSNYVLSTTLYPLTTEQSGHDVNDYLNNLNATYSPKNPLTQKNLRKKAIINFFDPYTYYSLYSWFNYIWTGKSTNIPMIPIGEYKYLPSLRLGLTPFGPEYFIESFLVKNNNPIYFYVKGGKYAENNYYGFGIEQPNCTKWKDIKIGYRLDVWNQPNILFNSSSSWNPSVLHKKEYGMAVSAMIASPTKYKGINFYVEPGFKTKGFLPGQALRSAPILRAGFSLEF